MGPTTWKSLPPSCRSEDSLRRRLRRCWGRTSSGLLEKSGGRHNRRFEKQEQPRIDTDDTDKNAGPSTRDNALARDDKRVEFFSIPNCCDHFRDVRRRSDQRAEWSTDACAAAGHGVVSGAVAGNTLGR